MIWKMKSELDFQWEVVEEEVEEIFGELLRKLVSELDGFKAFLDGNTTLQSRLRLVRFSCADFCVGLVVSPVIKNGIDLQTGVLKHQHGRYQHDFSQELRFACSISKTKPYLLQTYIGPSVGKRLRAMLSRILSAKWFRVIVLQAANQVRPFLARRPTLIWALWLKLFATDF